MPTLAVQNGRQRETTYDFTASIVIGRGGAVDFVLADPSVSRRHATLLRDDGAWAVEDLGSGNGTFVNERLISRRSPLKDGDAVRFGSITVTFVDRPPAHSPPDTGVRVVESAANQVLLRVAAPANDADAAVAGVSSLRLLEDLKRISTMVFDEQALLAFVVDELFEMLPSAERAFVMVWSADEQRLIPNAARTRSGQIADIAVSATLLNDVLERREAMLIVDTSSDRRYAEAESILALQLRSAICAPIVFQDEIYGVLQVDTTSGPSPFSRRDVALMLAIGSQAGMALGYARLHARVMEQQLLERDLELARKIQHHFLPPDAPAVPGYSFGVEYRPALAVGGDLYDFLNLGDSRYAIVVGDVSGKGVSAALYAAKIITELRHLSAGAAGPAALLARVNEVLASRDHEGMFVTAVLAVLDAARRRFTVASAGHPLPYARDAAGQVVPVGRTGGAPLGMAPGIRFDEDEYELDPGDAVVLYTDGVTEALNSRNELFGDSRVAESVRRAGSGADAIVNALDADARAFARGTPQSDDVTIVAFSRD